MLVVAGLPKRHEVLTMLVTNVRNLKCNPSEALRQAEQATALILKGNQLNALLFNLKTSLGDINAQLKAALAASLFKDSVFSLDAAAQISSLSLYDFIDHLAQLDIDSVTTDQQTVNKRHTLEC